MTRIDAPQPSHRADVRLNTEPYHIAGMPDALQLGRIDQFAGSYDRLEQNPAYQKEDGSGPDHDKIEAALIQGTEQYLADAGIEPDGSDAQREEYELARFVIDVAARTSKEDWIGDEDDKGISLEVFRRLLDHYQPVVTGRHRANTPTQPQRNNDGIDITSSNYQEALDNELSHNDDVIKRYADLNAERSKKMIDRATTREGIESAKAELAQSIQDIGAELYFTLEAEGLSHDEIVQKVDTFIVDQTDSILAQMEANRLAEYQSSSRIMKFVYDKWSVYGEQGLKGKLKKAALLGSATALTGAAVATGIGAVGAGFAGAGIAAIGARSFGRKLVGNKLERVANAEKSGTEQTASIRKHITDESTYENILNLIDESSETYRRQNRNRMIGGVTIGAAFGVLGGLIGDDIADYVGDKFHDVFGHDGSGKLTGHIHDRDHDGIANRFDHDRDGDGVINSHDYAPNNPDIQHEPNAPEVGRGDMFNGEHGSREFTREGQRDFNRWLNRKGGYRVKPGDSVWKLSEQYLHAKGVEHPTTYEVDAVKDSVLKELRTKGLVDSNGWLSAGDTIKIK